MKIKDVKLAGFTKREQERVRQMPGVGSEEEMFLNYGQMVADLIGVDIGTVIHPGGKVSLIKLGGE